MRKVDLGSNCIKERQFGPWLRAGFGRDSTGREKRDILPPEREPAEVIPDSTNEGLIRGEREQG